MLKVIGEAAVTFSGCSFSGVLGLAVREDILYSYNNKMTSNSCYLTIPKKPAEYIPSISFYLSTKRIKNPSKEIHDKHFFAFVQLELCTFRIRKITFRQIGITNKFPFQYVKLKTM